MMANTKNIAPAISDDSSENRATRRAGAKLSKKLYHQLETSSGTLEMESTGIYKTSGDNRERFSGPIKVTLRDSGEIKVKLKTTQCQIKSLLLTRSEIEVGLDFRIKLWQNLGWKVTDKTAVKKILQSYIETLWRKSEASLSGNKSIGAKKPNERSHDFVPKKQNNDISVTERTSPATKQSRSIKPTEKHVKNDINHVNSPEKSGNRAKSHVERASVENQLQAKKTTAKNTSVNAKNTVGVTGSGLTLSNCGDRKLASNKHVLPNPKSKRTQLNQDKVDKASKAIIPDLVANLYSPSLNNDNTNLSARAHPSPAFCDRLSLTSNPPIVEAEMNMKVHHYKDAFNGHYTLKEVPPKEKKIYRFSAKLVDSDGLQVAFIQYRPINKKTNSFRIEFNPKTIGQKGKDEIHRLLRHLFGSNYLDYFFEGNITRADATVDIAGVEPNDLLFFSSSRAYTAESWGYSSKSGDTVSFITNTQCIGSRDSGVHAQMYNKTLQLWEVKGKVIQDNITRIEAKINKPHTKGKGAVAIKVKDLMLIENPFAALHVAYYPALNERYDYAFEFFISHVRLHGADTALRMIKDRKLRPLYTNLILEHRADWWKPDVQWTQFIAGLEHTGLFPPEIFEQEVTNLDK